MLAASGAAWPLPAFLPPPGLEPSGPRPTGAARALADQEHQRSAQMAQLQQQLLMQQMVYQQQAVGPSQLGQLQAYSTSGDWVNAVLSAAPYLDAERTKQALAILDRAVSNLQQIKALDGVIASTYMAGGIFTAMPHLHAAEHMKAQVFKKQQALLRQLHCLGACPAAGPWPAAGGGLDAGEPQGQIFDERLLMLRQETHPSGASPGRPAVEQARPWPWPPAGGEAAAATRRPVHTLSSSIQALSGENPDCLFIVRRINKLGFKASKKLTAYFSTCGPVVQVLVAHSTARMQGVAPPHCPRRRPSSLGFVQMATPEGARRVLEAGEAQMVEDSVILVQPFERDRNGEIKEVGEDDDVAGQRQDAEAKSLLLDDVGWKREPSTSSASTKSTSFVDGDDDLNRQQSSTSSASAPWAGGSAFQGPLHGHVTEESSA